MSVVVRTKKGLSRATQNSQNKRRRASKFTMASEASLEALAKADQALQDILTKLEPFLDILSAPSSDPHRSAMAQTAVALSLGTLQYMGNRLRGSSQGKHAKDPLRLELNRMRQMLVQVQKKKKGTDEPQSTTSSERTQGQDESLSEAKAKPETLTPSKRNADDLNDKARTSSKKKSRS